MRDKGLYFSWHSSHPVLHVCFILFVPHVSQVRQSGFSGHCVYSGFVSQPRDPKFRNPQSFITDYKQTCLTSALFFILDSKQTWSLFQSLSSKAFCYPNLLPDRAISAFLCKISRNVKTNKQKTHGELSPNKDAVLCGCILEKFFS